MKRLLKTGRLKWPDSDLQREKLPIEGFNYEIKAWSTAAEGLARMGVT